MTFVDPGVIGECDARTQGGPIVSLTGRLTTQQRAAARSSPSNVQAVEDHVGESTRRRYELEDLLGGQIPAQRSRLLCTAHDLVRRAQKADVLRRDLTSEEIFELVPAASRFPDVILDGLRGQLGVERLRPEAGALLGR